MPETLGKSKSPENGPVVEVIEEEEEEPSVRPTLCGQCDPPETWCQLSLAGDIDCASIVPTLMQLIKSHIHRAAGACRWLEKDINIWVDFPITKFKKSFGVAKETVPWLNKAGAVDGSYNLHTTPAVHASGWGGSHLEYWGLAPAMQSIGFESSDILQLYGIFLEEREKVPFVQADKEPWENSERKMKVLVMKYDKIDSEPWKSRLQFLTSL